MTIKKLAILFIIWLLIPATAGIAAYHHKSGQQDSDNVLDVYPGLEGTKLDNCALCHTGGTYENHQGRTIELGSCQWCHHSYGYDGSGDIDNTLNPYGKDYKDSGRSTQALKDIENLDSDGDNYLNIEEIEAHTYPGNPDDHPGLAMPPFRIYTRAQLEALGQHTQFLLLNTTRSGDSYDQFTGVPLKVLLDDAGILNTATEIEVFAPDGYSRTHPLHFDENVNMYHVYGDMPNKTYQYPHKSYPRQFSPVHGYIFPNRTSLDLASRSFLKPYAHNFLRCHHY